MRALQQTAYGAPPDVVSLVDVPAPQAEPDEVIVAVEAAPVHLADLKLINGDPGFRWYTMPRWPGHEGIGRIIRCGEQVSRFSNGDRVFLPVGCGTFREQVAVRAADCIPAPEGDALQLSLMTVNARTALILLEEYGVKPGQWLLQNGANSSCGRFLIVLAREKGVKTINLVRRASLIAELEDLGADAVLVDPGDPDELAAMASRATGGEPVHVGIDCVASTATVAVARCLAPGGTVVNYGFMTGENSQMAFQDMFLRKIKLVGMNMSVQRTPEQLANEYARLAGMIAAGKLSARIAATYTLDQAQQAFAHEAETGEQRNGKIILLPNG